jgi:ABC-2 type transport system permease protein
MNKIFVIARREYMAMVATKTFLVTLFMMPILMFGGLILIPTLSKITGGQKRSIMIVDGTGKLGETLKVAANARNEALAQNKKASEAESRDPTNAEDIFELELVDASTLNDEKRLAWSDDIRNGKLYAFVEIPADLFSTESQTTTKFVSQDSAISAARMWLEAVIDPIVRQEKATSLGLDPKLVQLATAPIRLAPTMPYERSTASEADGGGITAKEKKFDMSTFFAPFGMMMLMFLVIFLAAQPMLESAMEEKSQRIAEVLLGSVTPAQLMTGKLLGNVGASLLVFTLYGVGAYFMLVRQEMTHLVPLNLVPWFIVFQILGVLFFSSIFMAIGASVRELKEAQSLLLPVWLVMMLPMMVWFVAVRDPLGPVSVALSLFPPSAPMMNILRMGTGTTIPLWQPILSTILLALATAGVIWMAGRVYRTSLLRNDSVKSLTQFIQRIAAPTPR